MKKGQQHYVWFLFLGIFIVVIMVMINIASTFSNYDEVVGVTQFRVMKAMDDAEKVLFYQDSVREQEIDNMLFDRISQGTCGTYRGFSLWYNDPNYCFPELDFGSSLDVEDAYSRFSERGLPDPQVTLEQLDDKADFDAESSMALIIDTNDMEGVCCKIRYITTHISYKLMANEPLCMLYANNWPHIFSSTVEPNTELCFDDEAPNVQLVDDLGAISSGGSGGSGGGIGGGSGGGTPPPSGDDTTPNDGLCTYCHINGWRGFWSDELAVWDPGALATCGNGKCCRAQCPSNAVLLDVPYSNQCQPDLRYGKHPEAQPSTYGFENYDACMAMCGPTSVQMLLDYYEVEGVSINDTWSQIKSGPQDWYGAAYYGNMASVLSRYTSIPHVNGISLSFSQLQSKINQRKPVIVGLRNYLHQTGCHRIYLNGHIMVVVGYIGNEYVILNDPYTAVAEDHPTHECTDWQLGYNLVRPRAEFESQHPSFLTVTS